MPEISFILPHWIYWGGIFIIPALLMIAARRPQAAAGGRASAPLAYFFLAVGGFIGIHRLYLKSAWAAVFIALFVGIIYCNDEARLTRNEHSIARNDVSITEYDIERAREDEEEQAFIDELSAALEEYQKTEQALAARLERWHDFSRLLALLTLLLLLADAALLPRLLARARARSPAPPASPEPPPAVAEIGPDRFSRFVAESNRLVGEFISCWTVIAVFVFYYEVIARYVFNSPTIWAHESMYLLFGMQYLLAGGFCLRENAHVRVDVLYMHLSARARAIADIITSAFFFLFTIALMITGGIFFYDSLVIREVSFTEWGIAYFPIKLVLPLGALLIILQGLARLLHNIHVLKAQTQS